MNFECGWTFLSCICAATKESLVKTERNSLCASENNVRLSNFSISLCDGSDINEWVSFPSYWKFSHADSLFRSHCNAFSLSLSLPHGVNTRQPYEAAARQQQNAIEGVQNYSHDGWINDGNQSVYMWTSFSRTTVRKKLGKFVKLKFILYLNS